MATTSPDNLRTPNSSDPYNLVPDLQTLASDVQNALIKRANSYVGTSSQRIAFTTAADGVIWTDTDGGQSTYIRRGGVWTFINTPATAWTDLKTLAAIGSAWTSPAGSRAQIKRIGNRVYLRGLFTNSTAYSSWIEIGNLPSGWRPSYSTAYFNITAGNNPSVVKSFAVGSADGKLSVYASAASLNWFFDGISWETGDAWPA